MSETPDPFDHPGYRAAIVDLLGLLAYGELSGFFRMAADAELAPTIHVKAQAAAMAIREFRHYELLVDRLTELGADPEEAMAPFQETFSAFHDRTRPSTWLEGLIKSYVGDGIATDFYREVAAYVDPKTRELIQAAFADEGKTEFVVAEVRDAIHADRAVGGRLALWARRLMGEALSQAQFVAVQEDSMTSLLTGEYGGPGADLAELGRMFDRLTDEHTKRMGQLGLTA